MKPLSELLSSATSDIQNFNLQKRIRVVFWIVGLVAGGLLAYTTRYFINGDAIAYVEMGEAVRTGEWSRLANLTYSPGYPVLLGIFQAVLGTGPTNELQDLRVVNFFCFVLAMAACEALLRFVRRDMASSRSDGRTALPGPVLSALWYGAFLVASLVLIRIRLLNPDMLVFAIVLAAAAIILWIRENPGLYFKFVALGALAGIGYLVKSFFLTFSPVLLILAGICCGSVKRAFPRTAVAAAAMLIVAAPLMGALSARLGRFSYGELGRHVYATLISGKGTPVHPEVMNHVPRVTRYAYDISCTQPSGFDICWFHEGLRPVFNLPAHLKIIPGTIAEIFTQTPWLGLIGIWFAVLWWLGCFKTDSFRPPSVFVLLTVFAVCGVGFYCLIRMEPRYIAPYLYLGFVGLTVCLTYRETDGTARRYGIGASILLVACFLGLVGHSVVDRTFRALGSQGDKPSYRAQFEEIVAVKDFLVDRGVGKGDMVSIVGLPPVYWARMAGARIIVEVNSEEEFLEATADQRKKVADVLAASNVKAVVAKGGVFGALKPEGWVLVPGTRDYYVLFPADRATGGALQPDRKGLPPAATSSGGKWNDISLC